MNIHQTWAPCIILCTLFSITWSTFRPPLIVTPDGGEDVETDWIGQVEETWDDVMKLDISPWKHVGKCNTTWIESDAIPWSDKSDRTSERTSFIKKQKMKPAGEFTTLLLQSMYPNNTLKKQGGDFWRVRVTATPNTSLPVTQSDLGDGTYEFKFLPTVSGSYRVMITLEYTLCDGVKEPPPYWFVKGNKHGKEQRQGILQNDESFINKSLRGGDYIVLHIPPRRLTEQNNTLLSDKLCDLGRVRKNCKNLWIDYGNWVNLTWHPLCPVAMARYPRRHQGVLWIFGDSVSLRFYQGINNSRLCTEVFKRCMYTYNWLYALENYNISTQSYTKLDTSVEKMIFNGLDFNTTKLIEELKQAIYHPDMNDEKSVFLFNYGLHMTQTANFTNFQTLIKAVIALKARARCQMIWRTTTSLNRHKYQWPNEHNRRFMTSQRVLYYNAYATSEFCAAGFDVVDVYRMTDSYPLGTGNIEEPTDAVHYDKRVMKPIENMLEKVFEPES